MSRLTSARWWILLAGGAALAVFVLLARSGSPTLDSAAGPARDRAADAAEAPPGRVAAREVAGGGAATGPAARAIPDGRVRGRVVLPPGSPESQIDLTFQAEAGLALRGARVPAGPFVLDLPPGAPALFLVVTARDCGQVWRRIPDGGGDVGTIDLVPGPTYGGWLVDEGGDPVPDVVVHLSVGRSPPSGKDGSFTIPLGRRTSWFGMSTAAVLSRAQLWFDGRGRFYPPVSADPSGFRHEHLIHLPEPGSAPRIRLVRRRDGTALSGVRVALLYGGNPFDFGRTDSDGAFDPRWPSRVGSALLAVDLTGGTVFVPLDRDDAYAARRVDVAVPDPAEAKTVTILFVTPAGDPVPGARLHLNLDADGTGLFLVTRTDGEGRVTLHLDLPRDSSIRVRYLRAIWQEASGALCYLEWGKPWNLPAEGEGRFALAPVDDPTGRTLWLRIRGPGGDAVQSVSGQWRSPQPYRARPDGTWERAPFVSLDMRAGRFEDGDGAVYPLRFLIGEPKDRLPDDLPVRIQANFADRLPEELEVPLGRLRQAATTGVPLDLVLPARPGRTIRVVDRAGRPAPAATLVLCAPAGAGMTARRIALTADSMGRISTADLPRGAEFDGFASDPATNGYGLLSGYRVDSAPAVVEMKLSAPEPLVRPLRARDGRPLPALKAWFAPRVPSVPAGPAVTISASELRAPRAALSLYRLVVATTIDDADQTLWAGPADAVPDPLVLEIPRSR